MVAVDKRGDKFEVVFDSLNEINSIVCHMFPIDEDGVIDDQEVDYFTFCGDWVFDSDGQPSSDAMEYAREKISTLKLN